MEDLRKALYEFIDYAFGNEIDRFDMRLVVDNFLENKKKESENENNKV